MIVYVLLEEYDCTSVMGVYSEREKAAAEGERHPWNSSEGTVYRIVEHVVDAPVQFASSGRSYGLTGPTE